MEVTVAVAGEDTHEVSVPADATYGDLARAVDLRPQAVSVLVEGSPVPADQPVETSEVRVLRLVRGG